MSNIRHDKLTGKDYTYHNIPVDKKGHLTAVQCSKGFYKIFSENHNNPDASWYQGRFIGDSWAVFKWVKTGEKSGFYQQVSPWYSRFGNAVRKLTTVTKEEA